MPLDISRVRAICFDVDGTLRDTDDQYVAQFARWLLPIQSVLPGRDANRVARRLVMRIESPANFAYALPDRLGVDHHLARLTEWYDRQRMQRRPHRFKIVEGAAEVLEKMSKKYPLAVVTARGKHSTYAFLRQFDIEGRFTCIATALTCDRTKPHPAPILWAAGQMDVMPEACLMVGDTTVDIQAGVAAGAQCVGVLSGFGEEPELSAAGADAILPSVADLPGLLMS